ncbi:DUF58 domain-containing protein [Rossellomorea aquimaris]|uniref:DUF58 domain-containing protein n=1 Tax=Rossellomorea aquimaris TaxID=189382 RepID=A0A5D4U7T6_9BACI|nr:DUF58 domain-containing protein [Rossellomorea aquimaris]TYS83444.1 DUF58 domain-containing protein [Rossellomorea aquimaris]
MEWKKETTELQSITVCTLISLILALLGLFFQNLLLLLIFLVSFLLFYSAQLYINKAGEKLTFQNKRSRERLNKGDWNEWSFTFKNSGLPILNGSLILRFNDVVHPAGVDYDVFPGGIIEMKIPFSIDKNESVCIKFPVEAQRRGLAKIDKMFVEIPNLFGSGEVHMQYTKPVKAELLVFPQKKAVDGFSSAHTKTQGVFAVHDSLFRDPFQPVGNRDYSPGDSFADINWKATARMQSLQTKVNSPATSRNWLITLNISSKYSITGELEELIERTAFIIETAAKNDIPYSLAINVRSLNRTPFYYLPIGEGKKQRQRALEMLSVLSVEDVTFPFSIMYQYLILHHQIPPVLISAGIQDKESEKLLSIISHKDVSVFLLENTHDQGVLRAWKQRSRKFA